MENTYQGVIEKLGCLLPRRWERVVFYAEYTPNSCSMKYFVDTGDGTYTDCFRQTGTSDKKLLRAFAGIHEILEPTRAKLPVSKRWTVLTLRVDRDGTCRAYYDYEKHDKSLISWETAWKKKYLK